MAGKLSGGKALTGALVAAILAMSLGACAGGRATQSVAGASGESAASEEALGGQQASQQMPTEAPSDTTSGSPWIDSNIPGNVTANTSTSPVDDFYLWVNHDWLASAAIAEGNVTAGVDLSEAGREIAQNAVAGADLSDHDARLAQLFYQKAVDTAARDAAGCEPARATVEDIRSLATIDDVSSFLADVERSAGVPTLLRARNKADDAGVRYETQVRLSDATFGSSMGTVGMDATTVDSASELYQARLASASAVLVGVGYIEEEAAAAFANRVELEKRIIQAAEAVDDAVADDGASDAADEASDAADEAGDAALTMSLDELDAMAGAFPLRQIVESRGYGSAGEYVVDEAQVRAVAELELVRDYLICGYALEAASWLDTKTYEAWRADYAALGYYDQLASTPASDAEGAAFNLAAHVLPTPVGRAFVEGGNLERSKQFVEGLCADAIATHKSLIENSEWLGEKSKASLVQKLDALDVQAVYPDVWEDYSGLDLDGLDYYSTRRAIWLYDVARNAALTGTEVDSRLWTDPSLIGSTARYNAPTNSFRIAAGAVEPYVSRYEAGEITLSELMGGPVGYTIFHEIAHSYDPDSINYGPDGQLVDGTLLTPVDLEKYQARVQKVTDYYDSITVWSGQQVIGQVCTQEAFAEMCGMRARLAYLEGEDGVDYQEFFEARAKMVCVLRTPLFELQCLYGGDPHPSAYLDVNVAVQQFDEFYDAYGVKEGDGMYLAPNKRFALW